MVSLLVHAALGVTVVWLIVASNPAIFRHTATGPVVSTLELALYVVGVASVALGWYFNIRFVRDYSHGHTNPIWGDGSWAQYIKLMYANPASSSAGQDYTFANVIVLPLMTIVEGRRRGIARPGYSSSPACSRASPSPGPSTWPSLNGKDGSDRR